MNVEEYLARWDAGELVRTCKMNAICEEHEYRVQALGFEILRAIAANPPESLDGMDGEDRLPWLMEILQAPNVNELGIRWAPTVRELAASINLAFVVYRNGVEDALAAIPEGRQLYIRKVHNT